MTIIAEDDSMRMVTIRGCSLVSELEEKSSQHHSKERLNPAQGRF